MHTKCFKFRLYPTSLQTKILEQTLDVCRDVYNSLLGERIYYYEVHGMPRSCYQQQKHFPQWAKQFSEIKAVFSQVLQNVAVRVALAFKAFFRRVKRNDAPGFPRFKGQGYDSFTYPQNGFKIDEKSKVLYLSKIGNVKAVLHRVINGRVKTCTIVRKGEKWYACFTAEVLTQSLPAFDETVGIDVGLEKFAALSNGEIIKNPRFLRHEEKTLAKAQRKLAKQKNNSRTRHKAKKAVRRIHERLAHRRHDFVHKTIYELVARFGLIAIEKLNIKGMQGNHCISKSIADAAWGMFRRILVKKAESAGRKVVEVAPAYTSQDCSECGYRVPKKLSERQHHCAKCGLCLDRDTNAAKNILKIALGQHSVAEVSA